MFNNNGENTETTATIAEAPLTMAGLLGKKLKDAEIIEGGLRPKGIYAFQLSEIKEGSYTIKQEEHPHVGKEALMITIVLDIIAVDDSTKYYDVKGKVVDKETIKGYVGKQFVENIMFGNDGIPNKNGEVKHSGLNKMVTLLSKFIGKEAYEAIDQDADDSLEQLVAKAENVKFTAEISHNIYKNAETGQVNESDQINLLGNFEVIPEG